MMLRYLVCGTSNSTTHLKIEFPSDPFANGCSLWSDLLLLLDDLPWGRILLHLVLSLLAWILNKCVIIGWTYWERQEGRKERNNGMEWNYLTPDDHLWIWMWVAFCVLGGCFVFLIFCFGLLHNFTQYSYPMQ